MRGDTSFRTSAFVNWTLKDSVSFKVKVCRGHCKPQKQFVLHISRGFCTNSLVQLSIKKNTEPVSVKLNFISFFFNTFEDIGSFCGISDCSVLDFLTSAVADPGFSRGAPIPEWGAKNMPKNCMKMKEIGLRGGHASLVPRL